jgi:hypothetical protein
MKKLTLLIATFLVALTASATLHLEQKWERSASGGNLYSWCSAGNQRDMVYSQGKLYVQDMGAQLIREINAATGAEGTTIAGKPGAGIAVTSDGKLLTGISTVGTENRLGIAWLNSSTWTTLIRDEALEGVKVMGFISLTEAPGRLDYFEFAGNLNVGGRGAILAASTTKELVALWYVENGVITFPDEAATYFSELKPYSEAIERGPTAATAADLFAVSGSVIWLSGAEHKPVRLTMLDSPAASYPLDNITEESFGTTAGPTTGASGIAQFTFKGKDYAVCAESVYGSIGIYDVTDGLSSATLVGSKTSNLGSTNDSGVKHCPIAVKVNSDTVEIFVYATNNGIRAFKFYDRICSNPVITPASGAYPTPVTVSITTATDGANIYYTTDGTTPSATNGTLYTTPFTTVQFPTTVKAITVKSGYSDSQVITATYTQSPAVDNPIIAPVAGAYPTPVTVSITSTTAGASIYYTTNGTTPSATNGTLYTTSFTASFPTTVKAIAVKSGYRDSQVITATYTQQPTADTPDITPTAGAYPAPISVTITTATYGAGIYYTTDGTTPSKTNGTLYSTSFTVSLPTTVKAIAVKDGYIDSQVIEAAYTQQPTVETPIIAPISGAYPTPVEVSITTATAGASIYYTIDGSTPSRTNGAFYTEPFTVPLPTTVIAIALKNGFLDSQTAEATYTQQPSVEAPVIVPSEGVYAQPVEVSITTATTDADIYYTTDETTPSKTNGTLYSAPFTVPLPTTVKAIALKDGFINSQVVEATYTQQPTVANPVITPAAGVHTMPVTVSITTTTADADIYYTTDETTPSKINGTLYSTPFTVQTSTTVKAIALKDGFVNSHVIEAIYTEKLVVEKPVIAPTSGAYPAPVEVSITTATDGANIYYTTDGSTTPSATNGTLYSAPFTVSLPTTVIAIALKDGFTDSQVSTAIYTQQPTVETPIIAPISGAYPAPVEVSITTATYGADIYYTTDGSAPSAADGTLYSTPFTVPLPTIVKAIAVKNGYIDSQVIEAAYTQQPTVETPIIAPISGAYPTPVEVSITTATVDADIYYTTDGTMPSLTNGTFYTEPFTVPLPITTVALPTIVKAIAVKNGYIDSQTAEATYTQQPTVENPVISPVAGAYVAPLTVSITTATADADIYYTTDGTTPSAINGTPYSASFTVSLLPTTVKAIALKDGYIDSQVTEVVYELGDNIDQNRQEIFILYASRGVIYVDAAQGELVEVYTVTGTKLFSAIASSNHFTVTGMPDNQVLVVKTGYHVGKVIL